MTTKLSTRKLASLEKSYKAALLDHAKFAKVGFTYQAQEALEKARKIKDQMLAG